MQVFIGQTNDNNQSYQFENSKFILIEMLEKSNVITSMSKAREYDIPLFLVLDLNQSESSELFNYIITIKKYIITIVQSKYKSTHH